MLLKQKSFLLWPFFRRRDWKEAARALCDS